MITAKEVIQKLDLKPLPEEGGFFKEMYRSEAFDSSRDRHFSTAIYYMVSEKSFSALHKVKSDEIFHFYSGDPVEMIQIYPDGNLKRFTLGPDIFSGHQPQILVPHGVWQALRLKPGGQWCLMGATVSPGFEFEDFEVGIREKMIKDFPQHREEIVRYTREAGENIHAV